jgi:hypothetical protein
LSTVGLAVAICPPVRWRLAMGPPSPGDPFSDRPPSPAWLGGVSIIGLGCRVSATGRSIRNRNPDINWLLRAEVARTEVPPTALVLIDREGYCLLDEYEIQNTRPRWLLSEWH